MMSVSWLCQLLIALRICAISNAINRPVYKIILNSKGYAQFIQYDLDVSPMREFTLCAWVRVTSLGSDQTIYTYVGNDDKRVMRLWLDSGGRQLKVSLDHDRVISSAPVEFPRGVWRDVCLSYQADFGAWALYLDAQLVLCEASRNLQGFEFPGQGRMIIGYGTSEKGLPTGLSGEIYGASMILISTIERNITMEVGRERDRQKPLRKANKHKQDNNYIVLGDLETDEVQSVKPLTDHKHNEHFPSQMSQDTIKVYSGYPTIVSSFNPKKSHDFSIKAIKKHSNNLNKDEYAYKRDNVFKKELIGSGTRDLPILLEHETPPPIVPISTKDYSYKVTNNAKGLDKAQDDVIIISDIEKPPPPEKDSKVYGQWTSSNFANNVLDYLKKTNFNIKKKPKIISPSFPIVKVSDAYPYQSQFVYNKIRPPINYKKVIHPQYYINRREHHSIKRRSVNGQKINVQIIKIDKNDDLELPTKVPNPRFVKVTNRGEPKHRLKNNSYRSIENTESLESMERLGTLQTSHQKLQVNDPLNASDRHRVSNLMEILPFLKSKEYFLNGRNKTKYTETNRVYSNSFSNANKWHNVRSYNNDYTPEIIIDFKSDAKTADEADKMHPSFKFQHNPGLHRQMQIDNDANMLNGRALAKEVSSQSKQTFPLLKLKLDGTRTYVSRMTNAVRRDVAVKVIDDSENRNENNQNNFNKRVKLGNALNEQFIIDFDKNEIKNTFVGGDDNVPDINKYRSKWNSKHNDVPSSLSVRVCKNLRLYVQNDGSVSKSKIVFSQKNIGIVFVVQSYKMCSMKESTLKDSPLLLIDWTKTPVKLFGGAYPQKTRDLCGFF